MASFGEELRRQRELRAISLREISDATKINIRFLEALEQNDFKHLPGGQFNKGFIRAYARHIGVSPEDMVNAYLLEMKSEDEGTRPSARSTPSGGTSSHDFNPRILVAAGLAIMALAAMAAITLSIVKSARRSPPGETRSSSPTAAPAAQAPDKGAAEPSRTGAREDFAATFGASSSSAPPPGASTDAQAAPLAGIEGAGSPAPTAPVGTDPQHAAESNPSEKPIQEPPSVPAAPPSDIGASASAAQGANLALRVIPFHPIRLDLLCNGANLHSGTLAVGVPVAFECTGVYEVSLEDAGAVSMTVNGERIYLGRPGQSVAGRHISAANYHDFTNAPSEAVPQ